MQLESKTKRMFSRKILYLHCIIFCVSYRKYEKLLKKHLLALKRIKNFIAVYYITYKTPSCTQECYQLCLKSSNHSTIDKIANAKRGRGQGVMHRAQSQ